MATRLFHGLQTVVKRVATTMSRRRDIFCCIALVVKTLSHQSDSITNNQISNINQTFDWGCNLDELDQKLILEQASLANGKNIQHSSTKPLCCMLHI